MTNRHKKIVLEAEEGITFDVSEAGETLVIRARSIATDNDYPNLPTVAAGEYAEELSVYTDKDGNQAVVPPGWTVSGVDKENTIWGKDVSLVIYRIPKKATRLIQWANSEDIEVLKKNYSQFVWVPVKFLEPDGTLDGKEFSQKFGRRNYQDDDFSDDGFNEPLAGGLVEQVKSVKKYGGFYISRYDISKSPEGEPQSVRGAMPWVNIDFHEAKSVAETIENNGVSRSQLTYGAEYDTVLAWLIKSECKTLKEVAEDSTKWGNHWNTNGPPRRVVKTGSCEEWCANNIYDFAGNVDEWTQEQNGSSCQVIRGGDCNYDGDYCPVAYRDCDNPGSDCLSTGFRVTVCIK